MGDRRMELHKTLCGILRCPESGRECRVYFQAPVNVEMKYPCILYKVGDMSNRFANNSVYLYEKRYSIVVIDRAPDSPIANEIIQLPTCRFNRSYTSDNLYHTVFTIY